METHDQERLIRLVTKLAVAFGEEMDEARLAIYCEFVQDYRHNNFEGTQEKFTLDHLEVAINQLIREEKWFPKVHDVQNKVRSVVRGRIIDYHDRAQEQTNLVVEAILSDNYPDKWEDPITTAILSCGQMRYEPERIKRSLEWDPRLKMFRKDFYDSYIYEADNNAHEHGLPSMQDLPEVLELRAKQITHEVTDA